MYRLPSGCRQAQYLWALSGLTMQPLRNEHVGGDLPHCHQMLAVAGVFVLTRGRLLTGPVL